MRSSSSCFAVLKRPRSYRTSISTSSVVPGVGTLRGFSARGGPFASTSSLLQWGG